MRKNKNLEPDLCENSKKNKDLNYSLPKIPEVKNFKENGEEFKVDNS